MKNIKTFEQFNSDNLELIEEGLFDGKSKKVKEYLEDITSGKFEKIEEIKKVYNYYFSDKVKYFNSVEKKNVNTALSGLKAVIENHKSAKIPENLEEQIAIIIYKPQGVCFNKTKGIMLKNDKGSWKEANAPADMGNLASGGAPGGSISSN